MRSSSKSIIILGLSFLLVGFSFGQKIAKTGFSLKLYTAPEFFFQPNLKAPMPVIGLRGGLMFNTTELEFGFAYFPKFYEEKIANPTVSSLFFTYHTLMPGIYIHQKIFAKNKHCFSGSFGISLIIPTTNYCDTTKIDGSHHTAVNPTGRSAWQAVPQFEFSLRYSYLIKPKIAFTVSPYFNLKPWDDLIQPDSPLGAPNSNDTYVPPTNHFSIGLMIGFHFMDFLSKEDPPRFYLDTKKKTIN